MPLRPVGNSEACQSNMRSLVSGASKFLVASSIISTTPSTSLLAFGSPATSRPSRRAIDDRTSSGFNISPSMAEDFTTSLVSTVRLASDRRSNPRASIFPSNRPCLWRTSARGAAMAPPSHVSFGQPGFSWMYVGIPCIICGDYRPFSHQTSSYSPHIVRRIWPLITASPKDHQKKPLCFTYQLAHK